MTSGWQTPSFRFVVDFGGSQVTFQEVSGLDVEAQPIEYRHGDSKTFSGIKMPGIKKFSDVTLKKGIFAKDTRFFDWYGRVKAGQAERIRVTISLLDESGKPAMVWTLENAWPTKVVGQDLEAEGNDVAIEEIVIAHEGLTIAKP